MDTSLNPTFSKSYQKYKLIVKRWEKDFVKENSRVPSKHDIREAPHYVRAAYKYYFNLKSEILEFSLMDVELDNEMTVLTEFEESSALDIHFDVDPNVGEEKIGRDLPSTDAIEKLMSGSSINTVNNINESANKQITDSVWGNHLNKKTPKVKNNISNTLSKKTSLSIELFKNCTFNKRNPRKSLSFRKSLGTTESQEKPSLVDAINSVGDGKLKSNTQNNLTKLGLEENSTHFEEIEQSTQIFSESVTPRPHNFTPVNSVQAVMMNGVMSQRNINIGWLDRCSEEPFNSLNLQNSSVVNSDPNRLNSEDTELKTSSECLPHYENKCNLYGLKNIPNCLPIPKQDEHHFSDYVENSESETELSQNRNNSFRKIRPVIKKRKLDSSNLSVIQTSVLPITDKNSTITKSELNQDESRDKLQTENTKKTDIEKSLPKNKNKNTKKGKVNAEVVKQVPKKRNLRNTKTKPKHALDSESEEEILTKKVIQRSKRKQNLRQFPQNNQMPEDGNHNDFENEFIGEKISHPRFPISSSILKESNLVDGLATALKIPKGLAKSVKDKTGKNLSEEDKLQKKIDDGRLNENFVRINLEKKVYVRGKKSVNFSKYKKQQWKNKKKMLHETPEFPEGGILKCFKCGQPGHFSRYCKAAKGNNLLALEDCDEKSTLISIQEAEVLQDKSDVPTISEKLLFECLNQTDAEIESNSIVTPSSSENRGLQMKAIHPIPETFIKLLAAPLTNTNSVQDAIEPLYQLNSDGSLIDTPEEVQEALKLFGHSEFRSGQEMAMMRILSGLSTLVTLSTGSGKSLCYQLPAYLYAQHNKCITLVISPLVSLMEDQVTSMPSFVHAGCLHTNQSPTQREKIIELIKDGRIHVLLISPEAIVAGERSTGFGAILRQLPPIAFACIDEVHCVSQWSHNFRPSYLMICRVLREKLGVKCILGLTATATKPTIFEIVQHLGIPDGVRSVITNKPLPDNLILTVSRDSQRDHYLLELLESERFSQCNSIIIYCIRRDECERVASLIRSSLQGSRPVREGFNQRSNKRKRFDWVVEAYHAGMSAAKRRKVQNAFMNGDLRIVVATIAFGMGINKSDIRGVIHYNMPNSFESYVQEVGRAGRDGLPAQCHVFIDREFKDKDELLRHIHANSIERHVIRKLLQKLFVPCGCNKILKITAENSNSTNNCQGHEVAFSVDETVAELDVPSENIATLLCYLELHPKKYAKFLSNVYIMCKIISYGGSAALLKAAEKCAPLAMAIALNKKKGVNLNNTGIFEFCVIEVAAAIGWESGVVKYHLKNLEWEKNNGLPKKSLLRVEFNTLGFRVKSPGDLAPSELDAALDSLYDRTQIQEKTMLNQLHEVSKALSDVSFQSIFQCSSFKDEETYIKHSNDLKEIIRGYFTFETPLKTDVEIEERPVNKEHVIADVRGLLATYRDCTFTGRAVARILQGISSPNFPAIVWGRCRYWRSHLSADFYKLVNIAKQQIISMK